VLAGELLREDLLAGVSLLLAGADAPSGPLAAGVAEAPGGRLAAGVADACAGLGAAVARAVAQADDEQAADEQVSAALAQAGRIDLLVVDGAGLFTRALADQGSAHAALRGCLDATWNITRAVVNLAFLPGARGGRIVFLAPPGSAGAYAEAARAGLENLARTLSIEWARRGVTIVTVATGAHSGADEVAALAAYLASPAGAYFSGALLDLRGV
jgi:NAD(P)-dependent dehydrogenase (short-subunit alcohol dehydrogenase family)